MKRLFLVSIIFFAGKNLTGQVTHSISLGPNLGLGANFGNSAKASIGGNFEYVAKFSQVIGARVSIAYNKFRDKADEQRYVSFLPVRAGVQAFIYQDIFFVYAEGGIATYKSSNPDPALTKFSWSLGTGYRQPLAQNQFLQFSAWFNYFKHNPNLTYTWFNFGVAYGLSFGKKNAPKE
jgi:hypothetical protein